MDELEDHGHERVLVLLDHVRGGRPVDVGDEVVDAREDVGARRWGLVLDEGDEAVEGELRDLRLPVFLRGRFLLNTGEKIKRTLLLTRFESASMSPSDPKASVTYLASSPQQPPASLAVRARASF